MPVIDGDEAILKYVVQNDGSDYMGDIELYVAAYSADDYDLGILSLQKEYYFKGKGGITELEYRFNVSELKGFRSFDCMLFTGAPSPGGGRRCHHRSVA